MALWFGMDADTTCAVFTKKPKWDPQKGVWWTSKIKYILIEDLHEDSGKLFGISAKPGELYRIIANGLLVDRKKITKKISKVI